MIYYVREIATDTHHEEPVEASCPEHAMRGYVANHGVGGLLVKNDDDWVLTLRVRAGE